MYVTEQTIGLEENYHKSITIFPNPTSNILHISHPKELQISEVSVIDSKGQVVMRPDHSNKDLNVEDLPNGLYILSLVIDQNLVNIGFGITK